MTDSVEQVTHGKRERLVLSARDLLHRQGVQSTTLAEVASAADVPVGNVYYYFKTKDQLVEAVTDSWCDQFQAMIDSLESRRTPAARLKGLARSWVDMRDVAARYGCPIGSLASELDKHEDGLQRAVAELVGLVLDWEEKQFRAMGRKDARELAHTLFAGVQGASLLANTLRDPDIMTRQVRRLERWIDSLA